MCIRDRAQRAQELSIRVDSTEESMRKYTLNHTQNLWDDLKAQQESLRDRFDDELGQLRESTTSRSSLGEMFQELAVRLGDHAKAENY